MAYGQFYTRGYLKFDAASVAGRTIKSAKMRFHFEMQSPHLTLNAFPSPDDWSEKEITWVNQPLKFPFEPEAVASIVIDYDPVPGQKNSEVQGGHFGELDVTEYVKRAVDSGRKAVSLCLAISDAKDPHGKNRIAIYNEQRKGIYGHQWAGALPYDDHKVPWLAIEAE
jgi:hypothetical protein